MNLSRLIAIVAAIACLLCVLCACGTQARDGVIARGPRVMTVFGHADGIAGQADAANLTIYLGAHLNTWTWAHEIAHVSDHYQVPFHVVLDWAGNLPPHLSHQQDLAKRIAIDAVAIGGADAHWVALGRRHGPQAIRHPEILNRVRSRL